MDSFRSSHATDVSVIIPCYQQGHFLGEAIESVLAQTLPAHEIIVVDDGSTDETTAVAASYPGVRYIRQNNSGVGTARNLGLRESTGGFLVFLDADDRLLSKALELGVNGLNTHPESAFVFGRCQYIDHEGSPLPVIQQPYREEDDYLAMLQICPIWHPAAVVSRRSVFDAVGGFSLELEHCSDYDFYLRATRMWPIHCHNELISEYRQHSDAKSSNSAGMLNAITLILRSQLSFIRGNKRYEEACLAGIRNFRSYYYRRSLRQLRSFLKTRTCKMHAARNVKMILRMSPAILASSALRRSMRLTRHLTAPTT